MAIRTIIDANDLPDCEDMFDVCKGMDRAGTIAAITERITEDWNCKNITIGEIEAYVATEYDNYTRS